MTWESPSEMPLISLKGFSILTGFWLSWEPWPGSLKNWQTYFLNIYTQTYLKVWHVERLTRNCSSKFPGRWFLLSFLFLLDFLVKQLDTLCVNLQYVAINYIIYSLKMFWKYKDTSCSIFAQILWLKSCTHQISLHPQT